SGSGLEGVAPGEDSRAPFSLTRLAGGIMHRSRLAASTLAVVAALWCVVPGRAVAQLSISPAIGVYIRTTALVKAVSGQEYKQEVSITMGGRGGLNVGRRAGSEASVGYALSWLKFCAPGSYW